MSRVSFPALLLFSLVVLAIISLTLGDPKEEVRAESSAGNAPRKFGVLLVSHGSRSDRWRKMLRDVEEATRDQILALDDAIVVTKTAFMEYTEPSIATRMKEFDAAGISDVIVVPLLLTVSSHSFDDIPTIMGQRRDAVSLETLKSEGIEVYHSKARVHFTPLLDFPAMLKDNVTRRVESLSKDPKKEGAVLVAYGSQAYDAEWRLLLNRLGDVLRSKSHIMATEFSWCGHIVDYETKPTEDAIKEVLKTKETAIVIPILVAVDEMFQHKIIGGAVENVGQPSRIRYLPDAILPDRSLNDWVVEIVNDTLAKVTGRVESR